MHQDAAGLAVTLDDAEAAQLWRRAAAAFLAQGAQTPALLAAALERAPGFALGHATQGLLMSLLARRELRPAVAAALARAQAAEAQGGADRREASYVRALESLAAGRMSVAARIMEATAARWPGDVLAFKLSHSMRFLLGDAAGMRAGAEAAATRIAPDHPHLGYVMGCRAFALEETGDYADAEATGRAGLDLAPDDAWGLHAVAHVHDMTGRAADGVRWLAGKSKHWAHCSNFGYHVWWHLALFHLDRGAFGAALGLYDIQVRPEPTDEYRDIANAASLLMRLELEGVDVGDRWEELGELSANRVEDGELVFADLHYLMALHRSGRQAEADRLTARIAADAQGLDHDQHEVCAIAGLPAARGLNAFRSGRWAEADRAMSLALPNLFRAGGSHAQRDVFERIAVEAALRAGHADRAEAMLAARNARRGGEDGWTARRREAVETRRAVLRAAKVAAE